MILPRLTNLVCKLTCTNPLSVRRRQNIWRQGVCKDQPDTVGQRELSRVLLRDDTVIKPSDKGGSVVIWRKDVYTQGGDMQLNDKVFFSQPRLQGCAAQFNQDVKSTVTALISQGNLPPKVKPLCIPTICLGKPSFYMLAEIHTEILEGLYCQLAPAQLSIFTSICSFFLSPLL